MAIIRKTKSTDTGFGLPDSDNNNNSYKIMLIELCNFYDNNNNPKKVKMAKFLSESALFFKKIKNTKNNLTL